VVQSTSTAVLGTLQMIDNSIQCGILLAFFVFIFDMRVMRALCTSESVTQYKIKLALIKRQKKIFLLLYSFTFLWCLITFFGGYIRGIKEPSFFAPRIIMLWSGLMVRFTLDVIACIMFLN
jgi:hypothetical protein